MARDLWIVELEQQRGWLDWKVYSCGAEYAERLMYKLVPHGGAARLYRVTLGEPVKVLPAKEER